MWYCISIRRVDAGPEFVEAYYNRGEAKLALNESEASRPDFRTALKLAEQHGHENIKANIAQRLQETNNTKLT